MRRHFASFCLCSYLQQVLFYPLRRIEGFPTVEKENSTQLYASSGFLNNKGLSGRNIVVSVKKAILSGFMMTLEKRQDQLC